jgi:hypothetical protein
MLERTLIFLALAALLAAPGAALAADAVVVPGADASRLTALDGTLVWTAGSFPSQTLMRRGPDGAVAPVAGAPVAAYRSIDLGHDARGRLVLTYVRCVGTSGCKAFSDDLAGRRATYKRLAPARCELTAAPARWGSRVAYGLSCTKRAGGRLVDDPARSGLFVRRNAAAPRRLRLPNDAVRFGSRHIGWVDLRGSIVGATASDVFAYAFTQTVDATHLRSDLVAASEGESDERVAGQSLAGGGVLWTLTDATHTGDPNEAIISRIVDARCNESEQLPNPPGPAEADRYRAEAMAVDGRTIYLAAPGIGIVTHEFAPSRPCG